MSGAAIVPDREPASAHDDFAPLVASAATVRRAVTASADPASAPDGHERAEASSIEAGVLVHRALQADVVPSAALLHPHERAARRRSRHAGRARGGCVPVDRHAAGDRGAARSVGRTLPRWRRHEVPFSLRRRDGSIVRGAIDAIIEYPDGRVEVLEFKTGRPRPDHDEQLAIYLEAARALFPGAQVEGQLIYAGAGNFPATTASNLVQPPCRERESPCERPASRNPCSPDRPQLRA